MTPNETKHPLANDRILLDAVQAIFRDFFDRFFLKTSGEEIVEIFV